MKSHLILLLLLIPFFSWSQLQVNAGSRLRMGQSTFLVMYNLGIENSGIINQDSGSFRFTGSQSVQFLSTVPVLLYDMEIAKTSVATQVQLFQDISISHELKFLQGLLDLNNNRIDLGSSGYLFNENNNGRVIATNGGEIQSTQVLESPINVNPGNLGLTITSKQNLGTVTFQRGHLSQTNGNGNGNSIHRYYDIQQAIPGSFEGTIKMNYFESELNSVDENTLVFWKSEDNSTWTNEGFDERSNTLNYVLTSDVNSFSRLTLSSAVNALPVTGFRLSGKWLSGSSVLDWVTTSEYMNSYFEVERQYAGENEFKVVSAVGSKHVGENFQGITNYSYRDPASASRGTIFYRLKQVDLDGKHSYSNIISLRPSSKELFINRIYPTISVDRAIYIEAGSLNLPEADLLIYDMAGSLQMHKKISYSSQWVSIPELAKGTYRLQIISGSHKFQSMFFKR